jgi:hypothetical protein
MSSDGFGGVKSYGKNVSESLVVLGILKFHLEELNSNS